MLNVVMLNVVMLNVVAPVKGVCLLFSVVSKHTSGNLSPSPSLSLSLSLSLPLSHNVYKSTSKRVVEHKWEGERIIMSFLSFLAQRYKTFYGHNLFMFVIN